VCLFRSGAAYNQFLDDGLELGMKNAEARRFAVELTNRYTQNYSAVAPSVGLLRSTPLVNPFISYAAEMLRVIKNLSDDVVNDPLAKRYGPKASRRWKSAAALTTYLGLGTAITSLVDNLTMDDEDKEKLRLLIPLLPPYARHRSSPTKSYGEDEIIRQPLNPWLPAEDFVQTAKAIYAGDWDALKDNNPVFGFNKTPAFNAFMEIATGRDPVTQFPSEGNLSAVQKNFLPGWFPGIPGITPPNRNAQKLIQGFTRNEDGGIGVKDRSGRGETPLSSLGSLFGVTEERIIPRQLLERATDKLDAQAGKAKATYRRIMGTNTNREAKDEARKKRDNELDRIKEQQQKLRSIFKRNP